MNNDSPIKNNKKASISEIVGNSELEQEIENLYNQILEKQKIGFPLDELLANNKQIISIISYILKKPIKSKIEIFVVRIYFFTLKKFMAVFGGVKTKMTELINKIACHMVYEEYQEGNIICKNGDKGDKFFLIFSGKVSCLIPKELNIKMSKYDYLKYLLTLNIYQEYELINKVILINKDKYFVEERELNCFIGIFRFYKILLNLKLIKEYNHFMDFITSNKNYREILRNTYDFIPENAIKILNLDNKSLKSLYIYFCNLLDQIQFEIERSNDKLSPNAKRKSTSDIVNLNLLKINEKKKRGSLSFENINEINRRDEKLANLLKNPIIPIDYLFKANCEKYIQRIYPTISLQTVPDFDNEDQTLKLFTYMEVVELSDGNIFGEIALQNNTKKRTATIITKNLCSFGTLTKNIYDLCLRNTQERLKLNKIMFFIDGPIFDGVGQLIFEQKYYNWFKQVEGKNGEYIFKQRTPKKAIYFIKKGEIEMTSKMSFKELNEIIINMGGELEDEQKIKKLCVIEPDFKKFYYEEIHNFKLCRLNKIQITGLDHLIFNNEYICDCKCVSNKVVYYELENNFVDNLKEDRQIKRNIENYIKAKKEVFLDRLQSVRKAKINSKINKINLNNLEIEKSLDKQNVKKLKSKLVLPLMNKAKIFGSNLRFFKTLSNDINMKEKNHFYKNNISENNNQNYQKKNLQERKSISNINKILFKNLNQNNKSKNKLINNSNNSLFNKSIRNNSLNQIDISHNKNKLSMFQQHKKYRTKYNLKSPPKSFHNVSENHNNTSNNNTYFNETITTNSIFKNDNLTQSIINPFHKSRITFLKSKNKIELKNINKEIINLNDPIRFREIRTKNLLLHENNKKPVKMVKKNYNNDKFLNEEENFFYRQNKLFDSLLNEKEKSNYNFVDLMCLDKWAEKTYNNILTN